MNEKGSQEKSVLTLVNGQRLCALVCMFMAFCPVVVLYHEFYSILQIAGLELAYASSFDSSYLLHSLLIYAGAVILIAIPIAIIVLSFIKKIPDKLKSIIDLICIGVGLIGWIIMPLSELEWEASLSAWGIINIVFLVFMAGFSVMMLLGINPIENSTGMNSHNGSSLKKAEASKVFTEVSAKVNNNSGKAPSAGRKTAREKEIIGHCSKCGSPIEYGSNFCTSCGTYVPESLIEAYETKIKDIERAGAERAAQEKEEAERIAREKAEAERIAREKAEAERIAREKAEAERIAREKVEAERIAREKEEAERVAREKAEAERIAREKEEAERIAREEAETEKTDAEVSEPAKNLYEIKTDRVRPLYCSNCGAKLSSEANFCSACGKKVN